MPSGTGPSRNVIVNEADDRKLGVYTEGDTDATIDGLAVLAEGSGNTLTPLQLDSNNNLRASALKRSASSGTYNRVEITTTARQVVASNTSRLSVIFVHDSGGTVYIGLSSTMTTAAIGTGFPIVANQVIGFDDYTGAIFAARESGASTIKYIEI